MQEQLLQLFSLGSIFLLVFCLLSILLSALKINPLQEFYLKLQTELIFFVSIFATAGSFMLSLYFGLLPCDLCWYQRIFLFPIPLVAFIATVRKDVGARIYTLALASVGLFFAAYHSLIQMGYFHSVSAFCNPGAATDCSQPDFIYYGFVTVPMISLSVFLLLIILSYPYATKK